MGGTNNRLVPEGVWRTLTNEKDCTIFIGADISNPPPFDRDSPSFAAFVSNIDFAATRYGAAICAQRQQGEIMNLSELIRKRLSAFLAETGAKPARLIYYRDGLAESQFEDVMRNELKSIRDACEVLDPEYRPKVTIIATTKRHHTRFFCCDRKDECGKCRNIPPGTMVDREVTSSNFFDFYLCSHIGIQGTSRPLRCTVLYDENGFSANEIQSMTHGLSNVYCRCTRSVSIPTPVYYAHWASLRAKHHLNAKMEDFGSETMSQGSNILSDADLQRSIQVSQALVNKMYFV